MEKYKTEVVKAFYGGHQVRLTIGHQSFLFMVHEDEEEMPSQQHAEWYMQQLNKALNRLLNEDEKCGGGTTEQ